MIDYSNYTTENPLMKPILEKRGIPDILKKVNKYLFEKIINNNETIIIEDIYEENIKLKNLTIILNFDENKDEIYSYCSFGIFSNKILKNPKIVIELKNDFEKSNLKKVLLHELLHIYEIYKRYLNKSNKDLQWQLNNKLLKIRDNYNDKFIKDLIYLIYISLDQEINARIAETYSILMDLKSKNKNELQNKLKYTFAWKFMNYLNNFDYTNYNINWNLLQNFFIELNSQIKSNQKFNIYKIPNNIKDCKDILKKWKLLFKKKSIKYNNKLEKIIDEVLIDNKILEKSYILFDKNNDLSDQFVIKYDIFLQRKSKLMKLERNDKEI